jgi:hypothetical protein
MVTPVERRRNGSGCSRVRTVGVPLDHGAVDRRRYAVENEGEGFPGLPALPLGGCGRNVGVFAGDDLGNGRFRRRVQGKEPKAELTGLGPRILGPHHFRFRLHHLAEGRHGEATHEPLAHVGQERRAHGQAADAQVHRIGEERLFEILVG